MRRPWTLGRAVAFGATAFVVAALAAGVGGLAVEQPARWAAWVFLVASLWTYAVVGLLARASTADRYYVAGRAVPGLGNGLAIAAGGISAGSFVSLAGALGTSGFAALAYPLGWAGGFVLLAVLLAPFLRRYGGHTIPEFLGARYGGAAPRLVGVAAVVVCSFASLAAQLAAAGLVLSWFLGLDPRAGVAVALVAVLAGAIPGGMRSVTWTQATQGLVVVVAYLVPIAVLSWRLVGVPIPALAYGPVLARTDRRAAELARDEREAAARSRWREEFEDLVRRLHLEDARDAAFGRLADEAAIAARQATPPAAAARALGSPTDGALWNFLALSLCLAVGTAGSPAILTRFYTAASVSHARASAAWALVAIATVYGSAPAYAALFRWVVLERVVGVPVDALPEWVAAWQARGLLAVTDKNGDGAVQLAEFVVLNSDVVVAALPEAGGLPALCSGLLMAGALAASFAAAGGLLWAVASAVGHDAMRRADDTRAPADDELPRVRLALVGTVLAAAWIAAAGPPAVTELAVWSASLAGASLFPALVAGVWWPRANRAGAVAGMLAGLGAAATYGLAGRLAGVSWGLHPVASAAVGLPVAVVVLGGVSHLTAPPPAEARGLVDQLRSVRPGPPGADPPAAASGRGPGPPLGAAQDEPERRGEQD